MLEWIDADVLPREYGGNSAAGGSRPLLLACFGAAAWGALGSGRRYSCASVRWPCAGLYDSELERRFWRHVESQNSVPGTGNGVPEATAAEEAGSPSDAPSLPATVDLGAMG
jgi:hypothetical protein